MSDFLALFLVCFIMFMSGAYVSYLLFSRRHIKELEDMLYDFDKQRAEFNQWLEDRLEKLKDEQS